MSIQESWYEEGNKQKLILILAALAIVVTGLFPPWLYTTHQTGTRDQQGVSAEVSAGYHLIFSAPAPDPWGKEDPRLASEGGYGIKLDSQRLAVEWIVILAASSAAWMIARLKQKPSLPSSPEKVGDKSHQLWPTGSGPIHGGPAAKSGE